MVLLSTKIFHCRSKLPANDEQGRRQRAQRTDYSIYPFNLLFKFQQLLEMAQIKRLLLQIHIPMSHKNIDKINLKRFRKGVGKKLYVGVQIKTPNKQSILLPMNWDCNKITIATVPEYNSRTCINIVGKYWKQHIW